jgi:hypothetical protein
MKASLCESAYHTSIRHVCISGVISFIHSELPTILYTHRGTCMYRSDLSHSQIYGNGTCLVCQAATFRQWRQVYMLRRCLVASLGVHLHTSLISVFCCLLSFSATSPASQNGLPWCFVYPRFEGFFGSTEVRHGHLVSCPVAFVRADGRLDYSSQSG